MATITTHVLDTARGKPASGVAVRLQHLDGGVAIDGVTDDDGRCKTLTPSAVPAGTYRLSFAVGAYFEKLHQESFYPSAHIEFVVGDASQHYHVPLLLAPYGYSTYRGS